MRIKNFSSNMEAFLIETIFILLISLTNGAVFPRSPLTSMGRIKGGKQEAIENHPYICSLIFREKHICGAVLVSPTKLLTAAHCTDGRKLLKVRCGSDNKRFGGKVINVQKTCQHKYYDNSSADNDISQLFLARPYDEGKFEIKPIEITENNQSPAENAQLKVIGWVDNNSPTEFPGQLKSVNVSGIDPKLCNSTYDGEITDNMFCAGDYINGGKDSCEGDSGGPIVDEATNKLVGLTSWGTGCGEIGYPGVYTNIVKYKDWIHNPKGLCALR